MSGIPSTGGNGGAGGKVCHGDTGSSVFSSFSNESTLGGGSGGGIDPESYCSSSSSSSPSGLLSWERLTRSSPIELRLPSATGGGAGAGISGGGMLKLVSPSPKELFEPARWNELECIFVPEVDIDPAGCRGGGGGAGLTGIGLALEEELPTIGGGGGLAGAEPLIPLVTPEGAGGLPGG